MKELNYTIPKKESTSDVQSSSKDYYLTKEDDNKDKSKAEIDNKRFKITQGTSHHNKKKLEAEDRQKLIARIMARDLDPSGQLIDTVKSRH